MYIGGKLFYIYVSLEAFQLFYCYTQALKDLQEKFHVNFSLPLIVV